MGLERTLSQQLEKVPDGEDAGGCEGFQAQAHQQSFHTASLFGAQVGRAQIGAGHDWCGPGRLDRAPSLAREECRGASTAGMSWR
jgi:hypothetical protein